MRACQRAFVTTQRLAHDCARLPPMHAASMLVNACRITRSWMSSIPACPWTLARLRRAARSCRRLCRDFL
eukprot:363169-Chlamydomonas_euryale.AAC.35